MIPPKSSQMSFKDHNFVGSKPPIPEKYKSYPCKDPQLVAILC